MAYRVIRDFADAQDKGYIYHAGDNYPRVGKAEKSRVSELSSAGNKLGEPLIEYQPDEEETAPADKPKRGRPKSVK